MLSRIEKFKTFKSFVLKIFVKNESPATLGVMKLKQMLRAFAQTSIEAKVTKSK